MSCICIYVLEDVLTSARTSRHILELASVRLYVCSFAGEGVCAKSQISSVPALPLSKHPHMSVTPNISHQAFHKYFLSGQTLKPRCQKGSRHMRIALTAQSLSLTLLATNHQRACMLPW